MPQAYGQWPLNLCQYGPEVTAGTPVNSSGIWRGPFGGFEDDNKFEEFEEDVGTFAKTKEQFKTWSGVNVPFPATIMSINQMPIILQASMGKVAATGSGPYVRPFVAVTGDTDPALQSYTLRVGNKRASADVQRMAFALVQEWELSGKQGEMWKVSGTWTAPRRESYTFSNNVPLPALDPAIFAKTRLFIDNGGVAFGTTQVTGVLLAASLKWKTNVEWIPVGDGNLYPIAYKLGRPEVTFSYTLELEQNGANSVVATERAKLDANAFRLIRLEINSNAGNMMKVDLAGKYDKIGAYSKEGDTNTAVPFDGRGLYSPTDAALLTIEHTSGLATIP